MATALLRPAGFDELGLRRALADRMLPFLVAAMAFLAALALAGWIGAATLARHWQQGAGASLTVQVPQPNDPAAEPGTTRVQRVLTLLHGTPGIASAHSLSDRQLSDLLRPWLGTGADQLAIPLPAVIAVRLSDSSMDLGPLTQRVEQAAPGTLVESHDVWMRRLAVLARSLQACAGVALLLVAGIAAAVIAVATRAGLAARREAIEIVHGLGATDGYIAGRFAARATLLAAAGGSGGGGGGDAGAGDAGLARRAVRRRAGRDRLAGLGVHRAAADAVADPARDCRWRQPRSATLTAQGTVRRWLRRLP